MALGPEGKLYLTRSPDRVNGLGHAPGAHEAIAAQRPDHPPSNLYTCRSRSAAAKLCAISVMDHAFSPSGAESTMRDQLARLYGTSAA